MIAVSMSGGAGEYRMIRSIPGVVTGPITFARHIRKIIVLAEIFVARLSVDHRLRWLGRELTRDRLVIHRPQPPGRKSEQRAMHSFRWSFIVARLNHVHGQPWTIAELHG